MHIRAELKVLFAAAYRDRVTAAREGFAAVAGGGPADQLGRRPVTVTDLAAALHWSTEQTYELLASWGNTLHPVPTRPADQLPHHTGLTLDPEAR